MKKKHAKLLTKTFPFGQICHNFCRKNFREFCVKLIFTWKNGATVGHLPKKLLRLKDICGFAWKNFPVLMVYNFQRQKLLRKWPKNVKNAKLRGWLYEAGWPGACSFSASLQLAFHIIAICFYYWISAIAGLSLKIDVPLNEPAPGQPASYNQPLNARESFCPLKVYIIL